MMAALTFAVAFIVSFVGSIPPATINLTIIQLGLDKKMDLAFRLALGAALMEYPYAWIAVKFESMITASPVVVENFHLLAAIVMTTLGILNLWSANKPSSFTQKFNDTGFRRGIIIGILNPLAIPFWIGVTAYLESEHWIDISSSVGLQSYLAGITIGGFVILIVLAYLAKKVISNFEHNNFIKKIPGYALLILGVYAFLQYLNVFNFGN